MYYFDVTIVNHYGKEVMIITTHPDPRYHRFKISDGKNHKIKSAHSMIVTMYILAYYGLIPIQIDGSNSVRLSASPTRENHVYYVPSGELRLTHYWVQLLSLTTYWLI